MKRSVIPLLILAGLLLGMNSARERTCCETPLGLDEYFRVPEDNPVTPEKIELGRKLFFDRRLSGNGLLSCASCHRPEFAFSDSVAVSSGVNGKIGRRNAPALINRAYGKSFFWDGRVQTLEKQVLHPISDSTELALPSREMLRRLNSDSVVVDEFRRVFDAPVSIHNVVRALASFVRSIRSGDSPMDRYQYGDPSALSGDAILGLMLFRGKANCTACHTGPNFTDEKFHNTGVSVGGTDWGRFEVTGEEADRGGFKTPTLREVSLTAPYMHDGSINTLEEVIEFYVRGGNANPNLDPEIRPLKLSEEEKRQLLEFLSSLSGQSMAQYFAP